MESSSKKYMDMNAGEKNVLGVESWALDEVDLLTTKISRLRI